MRMRSDFYERLKAFHYYGGTDPKTYGQYLVEKNAKKRGGYIAKRNEGRQLNDNDNCMDWTLLHGYSDSKVD